MDSEIVMPRVPGCDEKVTSFAQTLEQQLDYWRDRLANLEPLELPTDHPRPAVRTARGADLGFQLDRELTTRLKELSRGGGAPLHQTLLAAFFVLLRRYTGQADLAVGTVSAGRNHRELEDLVGFFVNTLVIRADLDGEPGFREVVERVREAALGAQAHEDLPFARLVG